MPAHERIKARRKELRLSLEDVAKRLKQTWPPGWRKIHKHVLSMIESGERILRVDELPHFAIALECRVQDLHDPSPQ